MTRPAGTAARIHRVRITTADDVQDVRPFSPDDCYVITDRHPYLEFEVEGPPLTAAKAERSSPTFERVPSTNGIYWQKWLLGGTLSADRRMGRFELPLQAPAGLVLQCYVVPAKLLSVADLWSMSEDVERELDYPAAWDPDPSSRVRSWVKEGRTAPRSRMADLLSTVRHELASACSLRREPPCEPGRRGLVRVPEVALVSQWAMRRGAALAQMETRLAEQIATLRRRRAEHSPPRRSEDYIQALDERELQLAELQSLRPQVMHLIDRDEIYVPIPLGPIVQRDHRLRGLLVAFSPPVSEVVSEQVSAWSHYPPVSLNDLFECWGSVWLADQLRRLGFTGQADLALGIDELDGCSWTLRRGPFEVVLDYEPHPAQLDFDALPSIEERDATAVEWAITRQYTSPERPLFGSESRCSPDYVLRIRGPGGVALAIGDACLADPGHHQEKDAKAHVLKGYRRTILWRVDDRIVRCDPLGAFVLLPGPAVGWANLESKLRPLDVWHFYPQPRAADPACPQFAQFIERLLRSVT